MKRIIQWSLLLLCIVSIVGCGSFRNNILIPEQLPKENKIAEDLEKIYLSYDDYKLYYFDEKANEQKWKWEKSEITKYTIELQQTKENETDTKKNNLKCKRNAILSGIILLMDIRYSQYERAFYNASATVGTAFDITVLGVTAAGTVAGGATTKSILSAIAAGLTGSKLSLEKNFLYEKASPVLIAKMRKLREEKLKIIDANMTKCIQEYPLERGLIDVLDYFYTGTVIGALQAVSEEIGKKPGDTEIVDKFIELKKKVEGATKGNSQERGDQPTGSTTGSSGTSSVTGTASGTSSSGGGTPQ